MYKCGAQARDGDRGTCFPRVIPVNASRTCRSICHRNDTTAPEWLSIRLEPLLTAGPGRDGTSDAVAAAHLERTHFRRLLDNRRGQLYNSRDDGRRFPSIKAGV